MREFCVVICLVALTSELSGQVTNPTVQTLGASTVEATIATLNGTVTPNGATTEARFNYGTTGSYGSQTSVDTIEARSAAFYFDGSTAALDNVVNGGLFEYASFTIEAWAKRYPNGSSQIIVGDGNFPSMDQTLQFGFKDSASGNVFTFSFYNDDLNSPTGYTDTLWHQWVGVYDEGANVRTLYRDGALVATDKPKYPFFGGPARLFIGSNGSGADRFVGKIAEVRIWTTALSQSTIQQWMYRAITSSHPNYGNLVDYWKIDEGAGSTFYNSKTPADSTFMSGNANWTNADWSVPVVSQITGLSGATTYHFAISATNSAGTSAGNDSTFSTLPGPPTTAATNLNFSTIGENSATIQWVDGDGEARLVVMRQDANLDASNTPVEGTFYTADSLLVTGSEIGTKGYAVYAGTGNSLTVTGLVGGHSYSVAVYEMNNPAVQPEYDTVSVPKGTFETTSQPTYVPVSTTGSPSAVSSLGATLTGTVSPNGGRTVVSFNYGTTQGYGSVSFVDTVDDHPNALQFDDSKDNEVVIPDNISLSGSSFTIEAWAKRYPNGSTDIIVGQGMYLASTDADMQFGFRNSGSGNVFTFAFYGDDLNTPTGYTDTLWHHWAGVYDAGTNERKIYRDGVLVANDNPTGYFGYLGNGPVTVGRDTFDNTSCFNGKIEGVRLWNAALSQSTIESWMYRNVTSSHPDYGNLIGEWELNEGSGVVAGDSSGHGYDGTVNGATWTGSDFFPLEMESTISGLSAGTTYHYRIAAINPAGATNGADSTFTTGVPHFSSVPGTALHFGGSGYLNAGNSSVFNFSGSFTIEAWIKVDQFTPSWQSVVTKGDDTWRLHRNNNTNVMGFGTTNLSNVDLAGTTNVNDGRWHYVAAVYDYATAMKYLYVDGHIDASTSATGTLATNTYDVLIGENEQVTGRQWLGDIDEVRIWGVARTEQEIRTDMFATTSGVPNGLLDYWQFNEGSGSTAADSVSGNNPTINGSLSWVTSNAPLGKYGTYIATNSPDSAGLSGSNVLATVTSPVDSTDFVGLYSYGSATDTVVTSETFPSGVTKRDPVIWGVYAVGNDTADLTLDYRDLSGIQNESTLRVLEREEANSPWVDVTANFTQNVANHTFTELGAHSFSQFAIGAGNDNALAVELSSFKATSDVDDVTLSWQTQTEAEDAGFNVLRKDPDASAFILIASFKNDDRLKGAGTTNTPRSYGFVDNNVSSGATYSYKIQSVSTTGTTKDGSVVTITVGVPKEYALYQNYPNPFNPSTTIRFDLKEPSTVRLAIYNILGQKVDEQDYGVMPAGRFNESITMSRVASGVYIYRLVASDNQNKRHVFQKKMLLVK